MNRDIKFRTWCKTSKKMVYTDECWIWRTGWDAVNRINGIAFSVTDSLNGFLMQYIGLKDKNGKEIYEGDVVLYSDRDVKDVIYEVHELRNCFLTNQIGYELENRPEAECEVVGNIYDNKNLLDK